MKLIALRQFSLPKAEIPYTKGVFNLRPGSMIVLFLGAFWFSAFSQTEFAVAPKNLNLEKGVALSGYDAIAYLLQQRAVKGNPAIKYLQNGTTYFFSSGANLEMFKKNPSQYEPAFGGWCAYAMAVKGEKVEVDPETFKIVRGRLYLFYNKLFNNTLNSWNKDETNLLPRAEANWNKLIKQ